MWKENLLKHQIEQVEKAGYHVIPRERVRHLHAQSAYDMLLLETAVDPDNVIKYTEEKLLLQLASSLRDVVRWVREKNEYYQQLITRVTLIAILPKMEKEDEVPRSIPRFADSVGRFANLREVPQAFRKGGAAGAG